MRGGVLDHLAGRIITKLVSGGREDWFWAVPALTFLPTCSPPRATPTPSSRPRQRSGRSSAGSWCGRRIFRSRHVDEIGRQSGFTFWLNNLWGLDPNSRVGVQGGCGPLPGGNPSGAHNKLGGTADAQFAGDVIVRNRAYAMGDVTCRTCARLLPK